MNKLYFGDNLDWLPTIDTASVDLIYLDPPFNSQATYNLLYKSPDGETGQAQYQAFVDAWRWDKPADAALARILSSGSQASEIISALHNYMRTSDLMAYLVMMTARLIEIHRVFKPRGSMYLHCDASASHYLKIILDAIFGPTSFRNEVIWKRTSAHSSAKRYGPVHDVILFYTRSSEYTWNPLFQPYDQSYINAFYTHVDADGRRWRRSDLTGAGVRNGATGQPWRGIDVTKKGRHWAHPPSFLDELDASGRIHWPVKANGMPMLKRYLDEQPGMPLQDVFVDIPPMHNLAAERLGYPTQKPLALLERLIQASSNPGDLVLDPFCGCGTAIEAAQTLGRRWIGVDITPLAIDVVERRLARAGLRRKVHYEVEGVPLDMDGARRLYEADPLHKKYELWALTLVSGQPRDGGKAGADKGVDGLIYFQDDARTIGRAVVSVKGGRNVHAGDVRDLIGAMDHQRAQFGIFVTMHKTEAMEEAARGARSIEAGGKLRRRVQILTIEELLRGAKPDLPPVHDIISAAASARRAAGKRTPPTLTPEEIRSSPPLKLPIAGGKGKDAQRNLPLPEPLLVSEDASATRRRRVG